MITQNIWPNVWQIIHTKYFVSDYSNFNLHKIFRVNDHTNTLSNVKQIIYTIFWLTQIFCVNNLSYNSQKTEEKYSAGGRLLIRPLAGLIPGVVSAVSGLIRLRWKKFLLVPLNQLLSPLSRKLTDFESKMHDILKRDNLSESERRAYTLKRSKTIWIFNSNFK